MDALDPADTERILKVCEELKTFFNERAIPIYVGVLAMKIMVELAENHMNSHSLEGMEIN